VVEDPGTHAPCSGTGRSPVSPVAAWAGPHREGEEPYLRAVRQFARFPGRSPDTATVEDLRNYQLHLVDHGASPTSLNAAISGLKFFFDAGASSKR
jgi:hypothetical protein